MRRLGRCLIHSRTREQFVGNWTLGAIAGVGGCTSAYAPGLLSGTRDWFFENATKIDLFFVLCCVGLTGLLLATHTELSNQGRLRRYIFLPFMRVISDASTIASGAFFIVLLVQSAVWASSKVSFPMLPPIKALPDGAPSGFLLFSLMALLTVPVRTVVDSEMDSALFAPAFGKETNIKPVLRWTGASATLTFALCLAVLWY